MEKNRHEFTIKIGGEEWEKAQDKAFLKRNKNAKIDGFRPGHAPKDVFIKHYGKESLYFDAADSLLNDAYTKVLEKEKLVPVVEPKVDVKSIDETGVEYIVVIDNYKSDGESISIMPRLNADGSVKKATEKKD